VTRRKSDSPARGAARINHKHPEMKMQMRHSLKIAAGLAALALTATTTMAMAPMPGAKEAPATFVNDQGVLMTVDPPSPDRQPVFVAIPLSADQSKPQETADRSKAH
jgi:hypothetical protein